jgi:cbb3-type cytochrome oxidase cytochrome c subunit
MAAGAVALHPIMISAIRNRQRELVFLTAALSVAVFAQRVQPSALAASSLSPAERGRHVYISQDCARCHSEPTQLRSAPSGTPHQGPDLSQVGARRSALWLKMHLFDPREVSGSSIMPAYAFLFRNERGNDLVAYLSSLNGPAAEQSITDEKQWHLHADAITQANADDGQHLYSRLCATCHNPEGRTRITWQSSFLEQPAVLAAGALRVAQSASAQSLRFDHLAHIVKFGIPASDMAGHEHLSDKEIASLILWLTQKPHAASANPIEMNRCFAAGAYSQRQTLSVNPDAGPVAKSVYCPR